MREVFLLSICKASMGNILWGLFAFLLKHKVKMIVLNEKNKRGWRMKNQLFAGLALGLFLISGTSIALAVDDATVQQIKEDTTTAKNDASTAKNKAEGNDNKITGLYDNILNLQSQIDDILEGPQGPPGADGAPGTNGVDGVNGQDGVDGINGIDGKSAYQIAVDAGFNDTEAVWLESLAGADGAPGPKGDKGDQGIQGPVGPAESQYVSNYMSGIVGTAMFEKCTFNDENQLGVCEEKRVISIEMNEGHDFEFSFITFDLIHNETLWIRMAKHLLDAGGYYIQVDVTVDPVDPVDPIELTFKISPSAPVYSSIHDPDLPRGVDLKIKCSLLKDSLVQFALDTGSLSVIETESAGTLSSEGTIGSPVFLPYEPLADEVELVVPFTNRGDRKSSYLSSFEDCVDIVEDAVVQSVTLESGEQAVHTFILHKDGAFVGGESCWARLWSSTGRLYDEVEVFVPAL